MPPDPRASGGCPGCLEGENLHRRAYEAWGFDRQITALGEEMSEATAAILRFFNGKGDLAEVREEMADVEAVLASMRDALGTDEDWSATRAKKHAKLRAKLDSGVLRTRPGGPE